MHLSELKALHVSALLDMAIGLEIDNAARLRKQELMFAILKKRAKAGEQIFGDGALEVLPDGFGFLRSPDASYMASTDDIYISPSQIRRFNLHTGDSIEGEVRTPKDGERYFALVKVDKVNGEAPEASKHRILFENLTPLHPNRVMQLEREMRGEENITGRIIDMIAPIGRGQRGLLVASPKSGKSVMLQRIGIDTTGQHLARCGNHGVVGACQAGDRVEQDHDIAFHFDQALGFFQHHLGHLHVARRRLVEGRSDHFAAHRALHFGHFFRAFVDQQHDQIGIRMIGGDRMRNVLQRPKRFFGAARNVEEGGSLTIIATALIETGSRMDDVIYEEFKGTGNMEVHLERRLAEKRVYPAINLNKSGTRREELLIKPDQLQKIWVLRKLLYGMDEIEAMEFILDKMKSTKNNAEFFDMMRRGGS
jgi:transcription termination factor Rho